MYFDELIEVYSKERRDRDMFHDLMRYRVREILLVASVYDAFVLEQDGALSEQIYGEFFNLNLTTIPRVICAYTHESAIEKFMEFEYDMVILMAGLDFEGPLKLAETLKFAKPDIPVLLLALNNSSLASLDTNSINCQVAIDKVFVWNGYSKLFVGMIKYIEDFSNVDSDTQTGLVQVILLVEDSVRYYSRFLPVLYSVVMNQTNMLVEEERSVEKNKILRMRWRPRILLATNYEEAMTLFKRYEPHLLTVISDIRYHVNGVEDSEAGFKFLDAVRAIKPSLPMLMQSSEPQNREKAYAIGAAFVDKNSITITYELNEFFRTHLGFGPFVFRMPDGGELGRAEKMNDFEAQIRTIPNECLLYHAGSNHFSTWLLARGETRFAGLIRQYSKDDFETPDELRNFLLDTLDKIRKDKARGSIPMLDSPGQGSSEKSHALVRLGRGSLGGKGRGLAFISSLIGNLAFTNLSNKMEIKIPYTAFIGTDEFDRFMSENKLWGFSWFSLHENEIKKMFLSLPLDPALVERLRLFLTTTNKPLAVRSSGLFEDMLMVTFSGVYETYIIPNANPKPEKRLAELCDAIRLIYASLYSDLSRQYFEAASYKIEEERMAVIIQELAGTQQGRWYYPLISGTAQSYNYYPVSYLKQEDGLCIAAIGLGCHVVDGKAAFRFSPRYPKLDLVSSSQARTEGTQRTFFALDMKRPVNNLSQGSDTTLECLEISEAETNKDFAMTASTFNSNDDTLEPGLGNAGPRIINFAPILKYELFPLAEVLDAVLDIGSKSMGLPVEIEFAVSREDEKIVFYFLQLKPLTQNISHIETDLSVTEPDKCFIISSRSMGNGKNNSISDIVWVDPGIFSTLQTTAIAEEIGELNSLLRKNGRHYVLVGPGRWGTRDFSLGIPVTYPQISSARVIIETELPNFSVESSQGSHFFHNLTSMNIGYLAVSPGRNNELIDWEWLAALPCEKKLQFCRWSRTAEPLNIIMNGRTGNTVIYKPS